ncbi:hypothetical protein KS4_02970 [Poriferisphaera corsica]|uniref:Uncharacterized protein n=1 Tax=Poriferisphaera corsica TaxID=2528020 RepID=A0A517YPW8_9BACT|nr:hypothetical protein KS4_02970 [Poriferisphaera corsica]
MLRKLIIDLSSEQAANRRKILILAILTFVALC